MIYWATYATFFETTLCMESFPMGAEMTFHGRSWSSKMAWFYGESYDFL